MASFVGGIVKNNNVKEQLADLNLFCQKKQVALRNNLNKF
jgi:hypothetical protein